MITTEQKDKILLFLIENEQDMMLEFECEDIAPTLAISAAYLKAIVEDMEVRGFLDIKGVSGYFMICWLKARIFDFYNAGGYQFEDHIVEGNIIKLKMEIESLEANVGKPQFDKMMSLVMGVIGGFSIISGKE